MNVNEPFNLTDRISIGVSAYGNAQTTKNCLKSILNGVQGNYELILVNDCSPDDGEINALFQKAAEEHKNTKIFTFTENLEYSGSLNCIFSHAQGERVFFISNDIFITPTYIEALLAVADNNPQVGIVRGRSNFVDNDKASHNIEDAKYIKNSHDILVFGQTLYNLEKNSFFMENYLTGDAFLTKKEVISKIGTFDPIFYGYFSDQDYGIRAVRAGYNLAVAKGAFAYHHQDANFNYLDEAGRDKKIYSRWSKVSKNWDRFKLKYGLPDDLVYTNINDIDWDALNDLRKTSRDTYIPPGNYLKYMNK